MGYPKHLINENENVILDLKPHWWYFSRHILTGIPLAILFVLMVKLGNDIAWYVFAALAVAWAVWLGFKYVEWTFTHFVVTDRRVIWRTGVLAKHGTEIPLERITNINFSQPIVDRIIGAGDLDIESAGTQGQSHFENVRHPDAVQQEIYRQIEVDAKRRAAWSSRPGGEPPGGAATQFPAAPDVSVPEQIEKLAELRDAGHISTEEYEAKKAELLGRM
ncbi:MAG: PH domain-containing protein [Acidimicrobiia bacterium]